MNEPAQIDLPFDETIRLSSDDSGSIFGTFLKGAFRAALRSQGVVNTGDIKKIMVEKKHITPDPEKLKRYCKVCGYLPDSHYLPITFPEILFIHPLGMLVTSKEFPLSPMGLIHLSQIITQHQPLPIDAVFDLECEMDQLIQTPRGILLDVSLKASIDGECVWSGVAGFISRNKETIKGKGRKKVESDFPEERAPQKLFDVPENTGRQYAKASGDYNPHHLYPITAKVLGYKKPIAHGMWSLARSLSFIEREITFSFPCTVEASFKRPIFMPANVPLTYERLQEDNAIHFRLYDSENGAPHLIGKIT